MPRTFSTDYTGRNVDLFIFQGAAPEGDRPLHIGFGGETGGRVTAGVQKMAQTYALLFLTEKGTVLSAPAEGSEFLTAVRTGRIRSEGDVQSFFGLADASVKEQMLLSAEQNKLRADEAFGASKLVDFNLDYGAARLRLTVRVTSAAGENVDVLLPVPLAIQ